MNIDAGKVEQKSAMCHRDMTIWQDPRKILRDKEACTFVVACKTQEKLAGTIMAHKDRLALEHFAAKGMPRVRSDVHRTEGAAVRHRRRGRKPQPLSRDDSDGEVREGGECWVGLHPASGTLVAARGEPQQVSVQASVRVEELMQAPI